MNESSDREEVPRSGSPIDAISEGHFTDPAKVERRVWRNIFVVIALGLVASTFLAEWRFTLGLGLGGALAIFNYKWMHASLREVLESGDRKAAPGAVMKFVLRWFVIGVIAYMAYGTGYFDPIAILAGLFAPAIAVIIEAGYVTYRTIVQDHKERRL